MLTKILSFVITAYLGQSIIYTLQSILVIVSVHGLIYIRPGWTNL